MARNDRSERRGRKGQILLRPLSLEAMVDTLDFRGRGGDQTITIRLRPPSPSYGGQAASAAYRPRSTSIRFRSHPD